MAKTGKTRRMAAALLLLISIVMLMLPLVPHHHHADGRICMKTDITATCCADACCADHAAQNHGCNDDCLTLNDFKQPQHTDSQGFHPDYHWVTTLFYEQLLGLLFLPHTTTDADYALYRESLHGTQITRAAGLRAPPCEVA